MSIWKLNTNYKPKNQSPAISLYLWFIVSQSSINSQMDRRSGLASIILVDQTWGVGYIETGGEPAYNRNGRVDLFVGVDRVLGELYIDSYLWKSEAAHICKSEQVLGKYVYLLHLRLCEGPQTSRLLQCFPECWYLEGCLPLGSSFRFVSRTSRLWRIPLLDVFWHRPELSSFCNYLFWFDLYGLIFFCTVNVYIYIYIY